MCGRYTLATPPEEWVEVFDVGHVAFVDVRPVFNAAPTQELPVILRDREGTRRAGAMRWGLIPPWAKDPSIGNRMINARSETLTSKPAFREAFRRRRCVVPMDGFYEWQARAVEGSARPLKIPFWIHRPDRAPFAVAGLWERWRPEKGADPWISFTLLTTAANEWMGPLHDRMPVVLDPEGVDRWLDPEVDPDSLQPLLRPAPDRTFEAWEVDREVNRPVNDHDGLIEPVPGGTVLPAVP